MSATTPNQTVFSIGYDFHAGNGDNGNVYGITNYKDTTRNQTFTYDPLNRLLSAQNAGTNCAATTANGKTEYWGNSYTYDAWGNLLQKSVTKCSAENAIFTMNGNNQALYYSYDAAGNMLNDGIFAYTFDQENRITGANGYTYTYDDDGNRVRKSNGNLAGNGTLYWYMTPGIVAETDLAGATKSEYIFFGGERVARRDGVNGAGGVFYYFSDHLKTASVVTDSASVIKAESDYYPWGGELQITANDSNHYKFTSKERDSETGLDYFGARYYSNGLGRWVSADWSSTPVPVPYADFYDPQTLNLYQFVGGNPASKADPDGHEIPLSAKEAQDIGDRFSRNTEAAIHVLKSIAKFLAQANASLAPPGHGAMPGPRICPTPEQKTQDNKQNNNNSQSTNQQGNKGTKAEKTGSGLRRPYIRKSTRQQVEANAKRAPDGKPIDPNTNQPIEGKPDMGHKSGNEFWREKSQAESEGVTQKEFNDQQNDPNKYQLEDSSSNRSHQHEKPPL